MPLTSMLTHAFLSSDAQAWLVEELDRYLDMHCTRSNLVTILSTGRAGVPMEVMGLMLGEFVDDYTVRVIDVFAMPQSGTGVSVEAVDPVFQTKMLDMLKQTGRYVPDKITRERERESQWWNFTN